MLTKMVDIALSGTFLAVHVLSRFRDHLQSREPAVREEDRLMAEWVEARTKRIALQAELDHPTASRHFGAQMKLLQAMKAARDKSYNLVVALRANRKA